MPLCSFRAAQRARGDMPKAPRRTCSKVQARVEADVSLKLCHVRQTPEPLIEARAETA
jgi:hypothetical protein